MKYQAHIDGLRAIAVIAVVMFHAFPKVITGGYIGVDIFFVISGYLITSIIVADLASSQFDLRNFYFRRIRRIFPALIILLLTCFGLGWFYLLADELSFLGKHIAAGATFTSNLLLWQEAGYFDARSESKPLLHLWSLGVEEQFYLVWPFLLMLSFRVRRIKCAVLLFTLTSFILNLALIWHFPSATFYLPLTRFWELGIGGVAALWSPNLQEISAFKKRVFAFTAAFFILAPIYQFNSDWIFPGFWALIPALGAALAILYAQHSILLKSVLTNRALVGIGLISFPLYLWHWPLLVFYRLLGQASNNLTICLIVLVSFGLAAVTFRYVEKPLRAQSAKKCARYLLFLMVITFLLAIYTVVRDGFSFRSYSQYDADMRWHSWVDKACLDQYGVEPCKVDFGSGAIIAVGDSHANHLYPGLEQLWTGGVANIGSCMPINPENILNDSDFENTTKRNKCFDQNIFNKQLEIIGSQKPKYVLVSMAWNLYFDSSAVNQFSKAEMRRYQKIKRELLISISEIEAKGATVVLVETVPRNEKLPKDSCGLRQRPEPQSCKIPYDQFAKGVSWQMLEELKEINPKIILVRTQDLFCRGAECQLIQNGRLLYRDEWHLSYSGSLLVGKRIVDTLTAVQ